MQELINKYINMDRNSIIDHFAINLRANKDKVYVTIGLYATHRILLKTAWCCDMIRQNRNGGAI